MQLGSELRLIALEHSYHFHLEERIRFGTLYLLFHLRQFDIHACAPLFLVLTVSPDGIDERSWL